MVQFHALGGVMVTDEGREVSVGGPRQRRLLTMLLIHRNTVVSADRLADAVFAGEPTPGASTTLRSYIARIRKVVATNGALPAVHTQAPGYVLRLPDDAFDVTQFEAGLVEGRSGLARGEADAAVEALRGALALWRGDAYSEFAHEDWVRPEAQRLDELRLVAHEVCVEAELAAGRAAQVVPELEGMTASHPLRERFVAQLMVALYRTGRHADALRAYQRHRDVLVDELGLEPSPALRELEQRVLAHDPGLGLSAAVDEELRGYRLGERLGTGEDGTTYAAHQPGVDRDIVVRRFRPELADAPGLIRAFEATAHRIAGLRHPAIVPIHDYWREPGAAYLVMRRMHGGSLADRLERADRNPLEPADVAAIAQRVGSALTAAHAIGLVHGRVTPRSILFDEAGDAWLSDFDLADLSTGVPTDDRRSLAAVVRACLPAVDGSVGSAIAAGLGAGPAPTVEAWVVSVVSALTGEDDRGAARAPNPYKGLRAFDESDAADFFGRSAVVDDLARRLGDAAQPGRLVLLVGGSGTGKSSAVRAGLLPRVRRGEIPGSDRWFVTTMLPGAAPFKELAAALRRVAVADVASPVEQLTAAGGIDAVVRRLLPDDGELLLVIDQLEELFTSAPERDQRRFLDGLVHAISVPDSRLRVVGTLRADFYDRPLAIQPFGDLVSEATVTIAAMAPADLEASIVEPARRAGRAVEGALAAELVAAARDEPAGLPSLQFTLFELAERTAGDLTLSAYRDLGGLSGAIAARAEALYQSLDDDDRRALRRLFGQLVVVNVDGEPTRRRAERTDLTVGDQRVEALVDRWVDARLLSVDRHRQTRLPTVEPAHEALLREWPRLRQWIDDDREALLVAGRLREAAASWVELDRDPGALYRGARLEVALDAMAATALGPQEQLFLEASRDLRDLEAGEAAAQVERQARANRRLRRQLVVIGAALVVALVGGFVAVDQRREAVDERRVAFARALAAAADANLDEDPERSMLLALEAIERTRDGDSALPEAIGSLHEAISRSRILLSVPDVGGDLDWSSDGSVFVTEGSEDSGVVDIRDAETGESVRSWVGHSVDINAVAFDGTGTVLATAGDDGRLRIWEVDSGDEIATFTGPGATRAPSFSPDGHFVAASWLGPDTGVVRVIDLRSSEVVSSTEVPFGWGTEFSPDGSKVLISSLEAEGWLLIDRSTGVPLLRVGEEHGPSRDARFSPNGRLVASTHVDGLVRVWDAATGELRFTVAGHTSEVNAVRWSAAGDRLATGGNDGTARVYEVSEGGTRGLAVVSARDTGNGVAALRFSPDGNRLMTADWAIASTKVWDLSDQAGAELANLRSDGVRLPSGAVSSDGRAVVLIGGESSIGWWDLETGGEVDHPAPQGVSGPVFAAIPSPDGELLFVDSELGLSLHDAASGRRIASLPIGHEVYVTDVEWSPDGAYLAYAQFRDQATSGRTGLITVVDRQGEQLAEIEEEPEHFVRSLAFTQDGRWLATARGLPRQTPKAVGMRVWDWRQGTPVLDVEGLAIEVAADPTGDQVAFAKELHGEVEIWDTGTGERVRTLRAAGPVYGVTWSADGERIAAAGADGTVRVFDAAAGRLELILRGHDRAVSSSVFSPDGARLVSISEGEGVRAWALDLDELIGIARDRLTRTLDDEECRQYLRVERCGES